MKKLIISKSIMFIIIVLFVTAFQSLFGKENTLIGVTTVIALLMYLERDLTVHPWKSLLGLLSINVSQGIMGYVSTLGLWIGIPMNFLAMFIVGYFFSYNLKKPLYVAFGLQYLFILTTPVVLGELPNRLLSLTVGALIILGTQLFANRNKLAKAGGKHVQEICKLFSVKLDAIGANEPQEELDQEILFQIKSLRRIIYFRKVSGYFLSNEGRLTLKISVGFEKLLLLLNRKGALKKEPRLVNTTKGELKSLLDKENLKGAYSLNSLQVSDGREEKNLYTTFIEDRILMNNEIIHLPEADLFLKEQRNLNHAIYELFLRIQRNKVSEDTVKLILDDIGRAMESNLMKSDDWIARIKKEISSVVSADDEIILRDILRIFKGFEQKHYKKATLV
ncbi:hypothetical protein [Bacillus sp. 1P06AnD]|uniref:hypothetical protein n=1 Tax=Bacillus sp. 1P06AnD TaxID=3132208 RepID=UPI00399F728D